MFRANLNRFSDIIEWIFCEPIECLNNRYCEFNKCPNIFTPLLIH